MFDAETLSLINWFFAMFGVIGLFPLVAIVEWIIETIKEKH